MHKADRRLEARMNALREVAMPKEGHISLEDLNWKFR